MKKYGLFFLIAATIAYASEWAPYYISLFSGGTMNVIGGINQFRVPCEDSTRGDSSCRVAYRIPRSIITAELGDDSVEAAMGLGVILYSTEIGCAENFQPRVRYGSLSDSKRTLDFLTTYQTIQLSALECKGDVLVKAWAPNVYRRYGHIEAPAVVGNSFFVERTKRLVEFFRTNIRMVLAGLFIAVAILNTVLMQMSGFGSSKSVIEYYSRFWLFHMLASSGTLAIIFPLGSQSFLFVRLSNLFSIIAHLGPILLFLSEEMSRPRGLSRLLHRLTHKGSPRWFPQPLVILSLAFVLSPYFAKGLAPIQLGFAIVATVFGFARKRWLIAFFSLGYLSDLAKVLMVPYLPAAQLTMVFALLCLGSNFWARVRRGARFTDTMRWANSLIETYRDDRGPQGVLTQFAERFGVEQATLATVSKGGCEIHIQRRGRDGAWSSEQLFRDVTPPVFAHVLTTQSPVWHIEEDSLFAINLRKGQRRRESYRGRRFTVHPLITSAGPVGAVALTGYEERYANGTSDKVEFTSAIQLLVPFLSSVVARGVSTEHGEWDARCLRLVDSINALKDARGETDHLVRATQLLARELDVGVFLGQIDLATREVRIRALAGYPSELETYYRNVRMFAVSHNEQGPMPLAVNTGRVITVSDVQLIRSVLHPQSVRAMELYGTRSCCAVPLFETRRVDGVSRATTDAIGVIWMESRVAGKFRPLEEAGLRSIGAAIEMLSEYERMARLSSAATDALAGFVPSQVLDKLLRHESVRQEETGYLLMADLIDSTRLSREIGADAWSELVHAIAPAAESLATMYGFALQAITWDAFFFTHAGACDDNTVITSMRLAEQLNSLFAQAMDQYLPRKSLRPTGTARARFCLTHGDITRDVRTAHTNHWTIVGTAMASIHKLEQACKGDSGWFFAAQSALPGGLAGTDWSVLHAAIRGTGEAAYRLKGDLRRVPLSEIHLSKLRPIERQNVTKLAS